MRELLSDYPIQGQVFTKPSVRALGETDINPVSGLGKFSQLFFAWIQPGNVVANIIAGGVAEAGAQQYVPSEYQHSGIF